MKALLFLYMGLICMGMETTSCQVSMAESGIYIYEYAVKKPNQVHIGFIIMENDVIVHDICYTVNISKNKVKRVFRTDKVTTGTLKYSNQEDGSIVLDKNAHICYSSSGFINRKKLIPDSIYNTISRSFFEKTNMERMQLLNDLL